MPSLSSHSEYRINVEVFEGPLDLLMHLIRKNDLDIYDIPIAFVLEEYMRSLDTLQELDIDLAGEFLLMAAELAHIKSRLLLPEETQEEEEDEADPRADLIRRLLEYQQFKQASEQLSSRTMLGREVFVPLTPERVESPADGPIEGSVYDLVEAFSRILKRIPAEAYHEVAVDRISINDRIYQIVGMVRHGTTITLDDVLAGDVTRYLVVITFIALLEMCRLGMVKLYQAEAYGRLYLQGTLAEVSDEDVARLVDIEAKGFEKPPAEGAR